jgi:hypothetical protein
MPAFPDSGENDAVTKHTDTFQEMEFSAGYNVKTAAQFGKMIQNGKISVGLYGKTQSVGQRTKPSVELFVRVIDGGTAVQVGWSAHLSRNRTQRHPFAEHFLAGCTARPAFFPCEMGRERDRVHVF